FKSLAGRVHRLFYRPALPQNESNAVFLHLGCGRINHPKFINIDVIPAKHIHYVRRIDNLSIFKDYSVDLIYASHCLEHFPFSAVPIILKEWYRVLKPKGILRLSVPDFELLLKIYNETGHNIKNIIQPLMGGQGSKYNFHYSVFNFKSLEAELYAIGFAEVRRWVPIAADIWMDDWASRQWEINGKRFPVGLNVEAIK
ncbi:MAG: methyltransferase domain-containing protein, partial [Candidatus Brocadiaceae bacterium]|nr:methyltransferase domain-containing protein [Candidatus Brocadiaceae bacterium]